MAKGFNRVLIVGNLGDEPSVKTTTNGTLIANLSIACNEPRKDAQTGQYTDHVEWFKVVCFGKVAEIAQAYAHKGTLLHIEGKLRNREYYDRENIKRYVTEIVCEPDGLLLLSSSSNNVQAKTQYQNGNSNGNTYVNGGRTNPNKAPISNNYSQQGAQGFNVAQGYQSQTQQAQGQNQLNQQQFATNTQGYQNQPNQDDPLPF